MYYVVDEKGRSVHETCDRIEALRVADAWIRNTRELYVIATGARELIDGAEVAA
jgi:hypothetical protein